jgi:hypothetical protein
MDKRFLYSKPLGLFVLSVYGVGLAAEAGLIKGDGQDHTIPVPPSLSFFNSTTTSTASYTIAFDPISGDWNASGPSLKDEPLFTQGGKKLV